MIRRVVRDEAYQKALDRVNKVNIPNILEQLEGKYVSPKTLAAIKKPATTLITPPVKLEGIFEEDKQVFLWQKGFICAARTSAGK